MEHPPTPPPHTTELRKPRKKKRGINQNISGISFIHQQWILGIQLKRVSWSNVDVLGLRSTEKCWVNEGIKNPFALRFRVITACSVSPHCELLKRPSWCLDMKINIHGARGAAQNGVWQVHHMTNLATSRIGSMARLHSMHSDIW